MLHDKQVQKIISISSASNSGSIRVENAKIQMKFSYKHKYKISFSYLPHCMFNVKTRILEKQQILKLLA